MGLGSTVGKYIVIVVGIAFYFIAITTLIDIRAVKVESQTLFDAVDKNGDGRLSKKEVEAFEPCEDFETGKFRAKMEGIGRRASLSEFQDDVTPKNIRTYMQGCADGAQTFTNPEKMAKLSAEDIQEDFFELYDLNRDGGVLFSEYNFVNSFNKKTSEKSREVFKFLDKVRDWRITEKQFSKAKLGKIGDADAGKKKKGGRRHH